MIEELKENQIFVFGSNLNGWHSGGAARQAKEKFGAIEGRSKGLQGKSYAIPTLRKDMKKINLSKIKLSLERLSNFAKQNKDKEFLLTPIGTGIAGFSIGQIRGMLPKFPDNVKLINWI